MVRLVALLLLFFNMLLAWRLYPNYDKYLEKRLHILNDFYFKANTRERVVALTFDDGPTRATLKVMRVLKEKNVPATFYLIAKKINGKNSKIYKNRLFNTGIHTYEHKNYDKLSANEIDKRVERARVIFEKYGLNYQTFRPAYGVINDGLAEALKKRGIKGVLWSNDTMDWSRKRRSFKDTLDNLMAGDIILMHDHATKPQELVALIDGIRARGFKIVPLEYLIKKSRGEILYRLAKKINKDTKHTKDMDEKFTKVILKEKRDLKIYKNSKRDKEYEIEEYDYAEKYKMNQSLKSSYIEINFDSPSNFNRYNPPLKIDDIAKKPTKDIIKEEEQESLNSKKREVYRVKSSSLRNKRSSIHIVDFIDKNKEIKEVEKNFTKKGDKINRENTGFFNNLTYLYIKLYKGVSGVFKNENRKMNRSKHIEKAKILIFNQKKKNSNLKGLESKTGVLHRVKTN